MALVYSYSRFSDSRQASGSSIARQAEYAERWAAAHGMTLDQTLSMRDEGLSGYHQRHVTHGALGVFLHAVEAGQVAPGSVLIVEQMDRLSRAEPLKAQAQFTTLIHAGITLVTAMDGKEYSLDSIKANPTDLIMSLLLMIRAHEESDTKSKRVKAAIRRRCESWQAGTWRGIIRNGKDPQWLRWDGAAWQIIEDRANALRFAVDLFLAGHGGVAIGREMAARGLRFTDDGKLGAAHLYKTFARRLLIGEREMRVSGETYRLAGYYPAILDVATFDALQLAIDRRQGRKGVGEIPSLLTGMGIAVCGYCGSAIVAQNLMGRKRMEDGRPQPGHRRLICAGHSSGGGCKVGGSIQSTPVENALMLYNCDKMRLDSLLHGGDQGNALRAELARHRLDLAGIDTRLARLADALAGDDGPTPITLIRQMRELEAQADSHRQAAEKAERELAGWQPANTPNISAQWVDLINGVTALEPDARMKARELIRASFSRITLWHRGKTGNPATQVFEMELQARSGGKVALRFDRASGALID